MKFAKVVFWAAGIYGVLVLTPLYSLIDVVGQRTPPAVTHPEYYYGFVGAGLAWQLAFLVIATNPTRYRTLILPAIFEKFSYVIAIYVLYREGRVAGQTALFGMADLTWGILFTLSFFVLRRQQSA